MKTRRATAYWWDTVPNFGDRLTPLLLEHFSRLRVTRAPVEKADIVAVGSIIEHVPTGWAGTIVGAGKLREHSPLPVGRSRILALRGPLTAKGVRGDFALGDPGLLASELVQSETKRFDLGVLPHWSDTMLGHDPQYARPSRVIIDPRGDPLEVVRTIGECRALVTSSLHGMILADAFRIPRQVVMPLSFENDGAGGVFKFRDYSQAVKTPFRVGMMMMADHQAVDDRKSELYDALRSLA